MESVRSLQVTGEGRNKWQGMGSTSRVLGDPSGDMGRDKQGQGLGSAGMVSGSLEGEGQHRTWGTPHRPKKGFRSV